MKKRETKTELVQREYDKQWQVVAKLSCARIGLTNIERIKSGQAVDLLAWQTVHVTKTKQDANKWLDNNLDKMAWYGHPYEVK